VNGVEIKVDRVQRALLRYLVRLDEVSRSALAEAGLAAIDSARETISRTTTRHTGALEDNWHVGWPDRFTRSVSSFAPHARFIEAGTKAHRITARRANFLRFEVNGQTMFRRSVWHPGTKARPFLALAMASGQMALKASAQEGVDRIAHEF
jgi:hypothetical protein